MNDLEAWIRLYEEDMAYARQHESLRSSSANLIAVATGAILAWSVSEVGPMANEQSMHAVWAAAPATFIVVINLLGWFLGKKHYERTRRHQEIAKAYRRVLSDNSKVGGMELRKIRKQADRRHEGSDEFRFWANCISVHRLWGWIHLVFVAVGVVVLIGLLWPFPF